MGWWWRVTRQPARHWRGLGDKIVSCVVAASPCRCAGLDAGPGMEGRRASAALRCVYQGQIVIQDVRSCIVTGPAP